MAVIFWLFSAVLQYRHISQSMAVLYHLILILSVFMMLKPRLAEIYLC